MESRTHEFASALFASVNIHLHCIDDLVVVGEVFVVSHAETVGTGNGGVNGQTWPKSVANVGEVLLGHAEVCRTISRNCSVVIHECTWIPDDVVIESLKVDIGGDPLSRPILPRIKNLLMLELIESFSLFDPAVHHRARFLEHFHESPHVIKLGNQ